ncbi:cbb3-type cytochrome c oxidase subunit I [Stygiolobus caldivivus]|nr:cbb3-type cytochrome c oxidase subunit I [Stygiolobus caldivivus]
MSMFLSKFKSVALPKDTLGVVWLFTLGAIGWLVIVGTAAMNMRTYLVFPSNSAGIGPTYYLALTLHGWSAMLGVVPDAAFAVIAFAMYKSGLSVVNTKKIAYLFWASNLGLLLALLGGPDMGWYMYPPLAIEENSTFKAFLIYQSPLLIGLAYIALAVNSIGETIIPIILLADAYATKPKNQKLNIFAAYGVAFAAIIALTMPALSAAEIWYALHFLAGVQVDPLLWLILFWFYGHPVVYYVPFPLFGALYYYIPKAAGRALYSEKWARWNIYLLAIGSMLIWVHHLQTFPLPVVLRLWANFATLVLAAGSGLTVLNLGLTILLSNGYNYRDPIGMSFLIALIGFILGGVQALPQPFNIVNPIIHNTYYIVGHFHLIIWTLILVGFTGVFLDLLKSSSTGFDYSKTASRLITAGLLLWTIPFMTIGYLMSVEGYLGMIRRVIAYPAMFEPFNLAISLLAEIGIPGLVLAISTAIGDYITRGVTTGGVSISASTSISMNVSKEVKLDG